MYILKFINPCLRPTGVECHLIGGKEMEELHPYLNTEDILGGVWIPQDACVDAGKVSQVLAHLANEGIILDEETVVVYLYINLACLFVCLSVCLFVSNKRQNG